MEYSSEKLARIVEAQRDYFDKGETLDVKFRIAQIKKLRDAVQSNEEKLVGALCEDLGRGELEAFFCEIGMMIMEINETLHGLKKWAKPEKHFSGLACFPSITTRVYKMPYGTTLIISPFNFPVLLSLGVLVASMAGGNTAVLKLSSKAGKTSRALNELISETFPPEYVTVIEGGHDVGDMCLEQRFDKIFYTGSPRVAKHVMTEAAKNLTPVALELGGETGNWCMVRKDANVRDAARKIAFFKILNAGQICININQVAVAKEIAPQFLECLKAEFERQIGKDATVNPEYPKLITPAAYKKCADEAELYRERIIYGGFGNEEACKYSPTVIYPVSKDEPVVMHELFCPLLPVVEFDDADADSFLNEINRREKPLAFYLFTKNIRWANRTMARLQYGGGCINEVVYHMAVKGVPFNGVGHSGMGAYHGEWGFREFTHPSTVLRGKTVFNMSMREHPYTGKKNRYKEKLFRMFER